MTNQKRSDFITACNEWQLPPLIKPSVSAQHAMDLAAYHKQRDESYAYRALKLNK